jgi:DNA-binding transcriptional ArsR family regulator
MMAFRVAVGGRLNRNDPSDAPFAMILRYDAAPAAIAARMRPKALPATLDKEHGNAPERVLRFLLARPGGATTGEIVQRVGLAQGTVSKLLTSLKAQGLVTSRRSGKHVFSRLTPRGRRAAGERPQRPHPRQIVRAYSPVPTRMATLLNEWHAPGGMPLPARSEVVAAGEDRADAKGSRPGHLNVIDRAAKDEDETPINMYASAVG